MQAQIKLLTNGLSKTSPEFLSGLTYLLRIGIIVVFLGSECSARIIRCLFADPGAPRQLFLPIEVKVKLPDWFLGRLEDKSALVELIWAEFNSLSSLKKRRNLLASFER